MAEIGSWNGHKFIVSPTLIRGFTGLSITGESNIENKETGGQEYATRKSGKPIEINLTAELHRCTGCDVRSEALALAFQARDGAKGYFYIGASKLMACQLLLTKATINETHFSPNGTLTAAKVAMTMRQCSKNDGTSAVVHSGGGGNSGSSSGGSSGSKKSSTKKKSTTSTKNKSAIGTTSASIAAVAAARAKKNAQTAIKKITTNAKKASQAAKKTVKKSASPKGKIKRVTK